MKSRVIGALCCGVVLALSFAAVRSAESQQPAAAGHVVVPPQQLKWTPIMPGAELAVISGDPNAETGQYVIRIKTADGLRVPPHWHPQDENLTVLQGTFAIGVGEKYDPAALHDLTSGTYALMPKEVRHFGLSKGETIIQIHGLAPFKIIYVNPADDPANKPASRPGTNP